MKVLRYLFITYYANIYIVLYNVFNLLLFYFQGESTDNFNWGVRRRPLSDGDLDGPSSSANQTESFSEETPVLSKRKVKK